jgi:thiamine pyrophosphokinase
VTLIGGAGAAPSAIAAALARAPVLAAADGGAAFSLAAGHVPRAVIGDMDSLDPAAAAQLDPATLHRVKDQDTTDFEKCLARIAAPLILGLGFAGGRLDHQLAAFNALVRAGDRRILLIGPEDVALHVPGRLAVDLVAGTTVSLFPMAGVSGRSQGLAWPIDGLRFAPDGRIGTSNRAIGGLVRLAFDGPGMLAILPLAALDALLAGLARGGAG